MLLLESKHTDIFFATLGSDYPGEAQAILAKAQATSKGIAMVSESLKEDGGVEVSLQHNQG